LIETNALTATFLVVLTELILTTIGITRKQEKKHSKLTLKEIDLVKNYM